jgi:hypothetical protein
MKQNILDIGLDVDDTQYHGSAFNKDTGAWYMYSWSPKWMLQVRGDWLSATIGDYSGSLWDAPVTH